MEKTTLTPFEQLKRRINREFPKKKLVGDIVISEDEYVLIVDYFQGVYRRIAYGLHNYPPDPVVAVALVQIGIRHYDSNFWGHVANVLGVESLPSNQQTRIGAFFYNTLKRYNRLNLGPSERVKNILMHGFVSDFYADDLFNFLFAFYRIDLERDLSRLDRSMMNELIDVISRNDNTGRTYLIVQQTADAILINPRGSKVRIRRLLNLIDRCFWLRLIPVNPINRLSKCFIRWQNNSKEFSVELQKYHVGSYKGQGKKSFLSPYLKCNFSNTTFSLIFPSQLIKFDCLDHVYWRISGKYGLTYYDVDLYEGVIGYKTGELSVGISAELLFEKFDIDLMCGSQRLRRFRIDNDCARFFNKHGEYIQPESLPVGEAFAFTVFGDLIFSEGFIDSERRGDLSLSYFDLQYGDILRLPGSKPLSVGKKFEEGILPRGRLAGAYAINTDGEQVCIYKKPPTVLIKILPSREVGTRILINDHQYRLFDETTTVVSLNERNEEMGYIINLADYNCINDGIYRVAVDVPNDRSNRYWEFCLINDFSFEFEDAPYVFSPRGTILFKEALEIIPDEQSEKLSGENAFNFEIDNNSDDIMFWFKTVSGVIIPVIISVPVFKWKFGDTDWEIEAPSEIWHSDFPTWIYIKYPNDTIRMYMDDSANDEVAEGSAIFAKLKEKNIFLCDMTRFKSWFGRDQDIRKIYLDFPNNTQEFISVVTRSTVRSCTISGDYKNNTLICKLEIIGKAKYYADIKCDGIIIAEKHFVHEGYLEIKTRIISGKYRVTVFEEEDDDTGFGNANFLYVDEFKQDILNPYDLNGKNILINHIKKSEDSVFSIPLNCRYVIEDLYQKEKTDKHSYYGRMTVSRNSGHAFLAFSDVRVEFLSLNKLNLTRITFLDDEEYYEFLYDTKKRIILKDGDMRLPRGERYRRYTSLFPDEYIFIISFIESKSSKAQGGI